MKEEKTKVVKNFLVKAFEKLKNYLFMKCKNKQEPHEVLLKKQKKNQIKNHKRQSGSRKHKKGVNTGTAFERSRRCSFPLCERTASETVFTLIKASFIAFIPKFMFAFKLL